MYGVDAIAAKRALTEAEWITLVAAHTIGRDGWPVNVREIQGWRGLASPSGVHFALKSLERHGLVATNPRWPSRRGGWRVTDDGYAVLNA